MRKAWWQVVVIVVCVVGAASALEVQGPSSLELGSPGAPESASGPPAASNLSTADRLQAMSAEERSNARLSLEGVASLGEVEREKALQVEALWNAGRHDEAIGVLSQLEAAGAELAAGIAWLKPLAGAPKVGMDDVRIGGTRQGAKDVALDFDQATGNLFAVVQWDEGWTVNISTDNGGSWSETYYLGPDEYPLDAAVCGDYLYVGYLPTTTEPGYARMRRFLLTDGSPDTTYGASGYVNVANVNPRWILDVSVGANWDEPADRLYYYFIDSNNGIRYFWADGAGTAWSDQSPSVSNAESNLDFHYTDGTNYFSWISYWGTDGTGHALGRSRSSTWRPHTFSVVPNNERVRVSAHLDNVFASYQEDYAGSGRLAAAYEITYNEGADWNWGYAYLPDAGEPNCYGMDITARGGWGSAVIYNREEAFDPVYLATREDYQSGGWNDPIAFNDFDAFSGGPSFIQYLEPLEAFGVVYLAGDSWPMTIPYFDVIGALPFSDGFETGDTTGWSNEVP